MNILSRFRGALLGLACGDAVGTTVEFQPKGSFTSITDMVGGGPFNLKPGEWTDDTSMALCLASSFIETGTFDPNDQMVRYVDWMTHGYMSSTGVCFDIGSTTSAALRHYQRTGNAFSGSAEPRSAGNGSIMRLAPVPMFFYPDHLSAVYFSGESSKTTHGAIECIDACQLFGSLIFKALQGKSKNEILFSAHMPVNHTVELSPKIQAIANGTYRNKTEQQIKGDGYVVNSLEAALWCFLHTDNFQNAVLRAVNLGDDADTTAAVCGQLAGAYYGETEIPPHWLSQLVMGKEIRRLAERLVRVSSDA